MGFSQNMISLGEARWGVAVLIGALGLVLAALLFRWTMADGIIPWKKKPPR